MKIIFDRNGQLLIHAKPSNSISNIQPIKYQEIPPSTKAATQAKFKNPTQTGMKE